MTPQVFPLHHQYSYSAEWIRSTSRRASMTLTRYEALSGNVLRRRPRHFLRALTWLAKHRPASINTSSRKGIHEIVGLALADTVHAFPRCDHSSQSGLYTSFRPRRRVPGDYSTREGDGWRVMNAGGKTENGPSHLAESSRICSRCLEPLIWPHLSGTFAVGYRSSRDPPVADPG